MKAHSAYNFGRKECDVRVDSQDPCSLEFVDATVFVPGGMCEPVFEIGVGSLASDAGRGPNQEALFCTDFEFEEQDQLR